MCQRNIYIALSYKHKLMKLALDFSSNIFVYMLTMQTHNKLTVAKCIDLHSLKKLHCSSSFKALLKSDFLVCLCFCSTDCKNVFNLVAQK